VSLVLRQEQVVHGAGRQRGEGRVGRGEDGEGALAAQGLGQAGGVDGGDEGGELAGAGGGVDDVGLAAALGGAGGDERGRGAGGWRR
jgi:hypothetical protein